MMRTATLKKSRIRHTSDTVHSEHRDTYVAKWMNANVSPDTRIGAGCAREGHGKVAASRLARAYTS
jgi:hypothetical protein